MKTNQRVEIKSILRSTQRILETLRADGITDIPMGSPLRDPPGSKETQLEPIKSRALVCTACRLHEGRTQVVFGEGSLDAKLIFIGEGPGSQEDLQGRPFVGAAGELLTKILQAMGLSRKEVYITNVVKCRPPGNRIPLPDEVATCFPYLSAQLLIIRPRVICALGKTAAMALVGQDQPMHKLRGQVFHWREIPVVVTFHPAFLLRNPSAKSLLWKDMKLVLSLLKR